jgi:hypothetical protein
MVSLKNCWDEKCPFQHIEIPKIYISVLHYLVQWFSNFSDLWIDKAAVGVLRYDNPICLLHSTYVKYVNFLIVTSCKHVYL